MLTFEIPYGNAGFEYLWAKDQNGSASAARRRGERAISVWVTPRIPYTWDGEHFGRTRGASALRLPEAEQGRRRDARNATSPVSPTGSR